MNFTEKNMIVNSIIKNSISNNMDFIIKSIDIDYYGYSLEELKNFLINIISINKCYSDDYYESFYNTYLYSLKCKNKLMKIINDKIINGMIQNKIEYFEKNDWDCYIELLFMEKIKFINKLLNDECMFNYYMNISNEKKLVKNKNFD